MNDLLEKLRKDFYLTKRRILKELDVMERKLELAPHHMNRSNTRKVKEKMFLQTFEFPKLTGKKEWVLDKAAVYLLPPKAKKLNRAQKALLEELSDFFNKEGIYTIADVVKHDEGYYLDKSRRHLGKKAMLLLTESLHHNKLEFDMDVDLHKHSRHHSLSPIHDYLHSHL